jgi:diaminopimelate epimerase
MRKWERIMHFVKMQGAGNDYVYVDTFRAPPPPDLAELAVRVSRRHTGIGADGLILIEPAATADARMRMWNADGSEAGMCGNGLRCVAKYLHDRGLVSGPEMQIESGEGTVTAWIESSTPRESRVRISVGRPKLATAEIPTTLVGRIANPSDDRPVLDVPLPCGDREFRVCCVSMGNPHCVIFVDEPTDELVLRYGPLLERHAAFPERTNVEFVQVAARDELRMRVWERGSGETQACGSGACAAVVVAALTHRSGRQVRCRLPGGELDVAWDESDVVFLTGPAVEVFSGNWSDERVD